MLSPKRNPFGPQINPLFDYNTPPIWAGPQFDAQDAQTDAVKVSGTVPPVGVLQQSPKAEASQGTGLWDPGNRHKTLLAIGSALLSGKDFFSGVGQAGQNIMGLSDSLKAAKKKQAPEIGGPDNSFEIHTDPETGKRTYVPIAAFQDYKNGSKVKNKDVMDQEGRVNYGILQLDEKDRPAAYAEIMANPKRYNVDTTDWPATYDPRFSTIAATAGSSVSQNRTRETADRGQEFREDLGNRNYEVRKGRAENLNAATNIRTGLAVSKAKAPPSTRKGSTARGSSSSGSVRVINGVVYRRKSK